MKLRRRLLLLPALCTTCLAACGSYATTYTAISTLPSDDNLPAWRDAVRCARRHGMPWLPDPVIGAQGRVTLPGLSPTPVPIPAVKAACAAQLRKITASTSTQQPVSAADAEKLVRLARCSSGHGLPRWPDPVPSQPGAFHVRSADAGTPARFAAALRACNAFTPASGWHLRVTPSGQ